MKRYPPDQCRRCGRRHEECYQLVDGENRWAMASVRCECGHAWTLLHTAPPNLAALRAWMRRGCQPTDGPLAPLRSGPWQQYRLEGVLPAFLAMEGSDYSGSGAHLS